MKRAALIFTISMLFGSTAFGQNITSLSQLTSFANCTTYSCFQKKAKGLGFTFWKQTEEGISKPYYYTKSIDNGTWKIDLRLSWLEREYSTPVITYATNSYAQANFKEQIKQEALKQGYKMVAGGEQVMENGMRGVSYESAKYHIVLSENSVVAGKDRYTNYNISLYRK